MVTEHKIHDEFATQDATITIGDGWVTFNMGKSNTELEITLFNSTSVEIKYSDGLNKCKIGKTGEVYRIEEKFLRLKEFLENRL